MREAAERALAHAVTNENLRDPALLGKSQDGVNGVFAFKVYNAGPGLSCHLQISIESNLVVGGEIGLAHICGENLAMKTVGNTAAAFQHAGGIGAGRQADENALLHAEARFDAVLMEIGFQLT